jgi:hypothetical protein
MFRLEKADLESPGALKGLAKAANMPLKAFRERFGYLAREDAPCPERAV